MYTGGVVLREIEFRAWDKEEKRYWFDCQNVYDSSNAPCCCSAFGHFLSVKMQDEDYFDTEENRFNVEQYTGLRDKNGKKIFEGDKVRTWNGNKGFISYNNGSWCIGKKQREIETYEYKNIEILGNIHENPELLEVKKC